MRILLLAEELGIGGLPNYVLALARVLMEAGLEVMVAHGNAPLPVHLELDGLMLLYVPGIAAGARGPSIRDAIATLRAWAPDVVHVHLGTNLEVISGLLDSGLPLVRSYHDYTSLCLRRGRRRWRGDRCHRGLGWSCAGWGCFLTPPSDGSWRPGLGNLAAKIAERDRYRGFGASVVGSRHMAETLRRNGFADSTIHVVPHFSRFEADATVAVPPPKRDGTPGRDRPFELLFSGQAVSGKGLEILVEALHGVRREWRLSVLSEGPRLEAAQALANKLGLADRIRFLGWATQSATRDHYRLADLLVIPSVWDDPVPLVGLEAMSFGTPLVGFGVGGIPDYLFDGRTGVLVQDVSVDGLRKGLERAMADPALVALWGEEARSLVAQAHTRQAHVAALRTVYAAVGATPASIPPLAVAVDA